MNNKKYNGAARTLTDFEWIHDFICHFSPHAQKHKDMLPCICLQLPGECAECVYYIVKGVSRKSLNQTGYFSRGQANTRNFVCI